MKLLPSLILAACMATPSISLAENPETELASATTFESPAPAVEESTESDTFTSGYKEDAGFLYLEYLGRFKKDWDLGFSLRYHWFDFGALMNIGSSIDSFNAWMLRVGAGGAYYLNKNIFVDGAVGLSYSHSSFETRVEKGTRGHVLNLGSSINKTKYETEKHSNGGFGVYLIPRIGLNIGKGFSISAGYQMNAAKFKFDNFFDKGVAVIGLGFVN